MCKHTGDVNAMGVGREQHGVVQATICITVGTVIDGQEYRTLRGSKFRSMHSIRIDLLEVLVIASKDSCS